MVFNSIDDCQLERELLHASVPLIHPTWRLDHYRFVADSYADSLGEEISPVFTDFAMLCNLVLGLWSRGFYTNWKT